MSTINLLPDDYLKRRWQARANRLCLLLFIVVIIGVLGAAVVSERSVENTLTVRDNVNDQYAEAGRLISQMQELEVRKARMLEKADLTSSLIERVPRSTLLAVVTNALPKGASLKELQLASKRILRATPARVVQKAAADKVAVVKKVRDVAVEMTATGLAGTDVQVARFIANLARNPLIRTVDLVYSKEISREKIKVREFQVTIALRNGMDAIVVTKQVAARDKDPSTTATPTGDVK